MLVVLASRLDEKARGLVNEWASHGARLMTPDDLSKPGWKDFVRPEGYEDSVAVVGGEKVRFGEISGVLVRLPVVMEAELGHIVKADRAYVAAEMTAYLVSWLTRLRCPVLNRPSPTSLIGPGWRAEKWMQKAVGLGMSIRAGRLGTGARRHKRVRTKAKPTEVTVVGERVFGTSNAFVSRFTRDLASAAGVDVMTVFVEGTPDRPVFLGVSTWPRPDKPEVRDAILEMLLGMKVKASPVRRGTA